MEKGGCHERFCCGMGVCSCMILQNCLPKCRFDKVGAVAIEGEEYLDDRKWMGLLGQVDWPRTNFEHFINLFNLTAIVSYCVEESMAISDCRNIENKFEEELDGVEIQPLPPHPKCKEASRVTVGLHSISLACGGC
jgi:hypothetical protein